MSSVPDPWVDGQTFGQVLSRTVQRFGDREALVFPHLDYRLTYSEFQNEVRELARGLLALGVEPGEHVGVWATNWPQWVILQFAVAEIGAVLINVNPAYRAQELEYVLNQADITLLFLTDRVKTSDCFTIFETICPEILESGKGEVGAKACPKLRQVVSIKEYPRPGYLTWNDVQQLADSISTEQFDQRRSEVQSGDVVNVQYTSGTTGFPKGAMLTHRNLLLNAYYVGDRQSFSENDRLCIPVPFYHCFGCVMGTLMCVIYGATMVAPSEVFDADATLEAIENESCTGIYGVPTMFRAELNHPHFDEFDLSTLRTGVMAGSPCPVDLMKAVEEKMGVSEITIAYGLTEASPVITQTKIDDSREQRVGSVGTLLPGLEVMIVQPGTLMPARAGESGELIVRGHGVMKGYYNKPDETAKAITPDGWLFSGDLASLSDDGYYHIQGRIKDLIIRGGENIYPREIEDYLRTHPDVMDVQVVGLPDEKFGEVISAWIRPKADVRVTEKDIRDYCHEKIAHFKIPQYVVFLDEYPTTVTGKVQKFKLREMGIEQFELQKDAGIETA